MMNNRIFTVQDQLAFAKLSGDYNPLHIDNVLARRLMFGSVVVHGVFTLLWALDSWLQDKTEYIKLDEVKGTFLNPIRINEKVSYLINKEIDGSVEIVLLVGDIIATSIAIKWSTTTKHGSDTVSNRIPKRSKCLPLLANNIGKVSGELPLYFNSGVASVVFTKKIVTLIPLLQIAQLLATTRLVGMNCPGLHSIFSKLDLTFEENTFRKHILTYEVTKVHKQYNKVIQKISSQNMNGLVTAFIRPPPQQQIYFNKLDEKINRTEFLSQRALVIGGSRGLGEVTAKILSFGGADVKITYHKGVEDAYKVVDEITSGGGIADCFYLNVLEDNVDFLSILDKKWAPTHLYYYATPFIESRKNKLFSTQLFQKFCDFYVVGFHRIVEQLSQIGLRGILYPSTVFIENIPYNMGEYVIAKVAGEQLCSYLEKTKKGIIFHKPRLPKVSTDQTSSFAPTINEDPALIMLNHLRNLRDSSKLE